MSNQIDAMEMQQENFSGDVRNENKRVLKEVQKANRKLAENNSSQMIQLQAQFLQEVEAKLTGEVPCGQADQEGPEPRGEWAQRANSTPGNPNNDRIEDPSYKYADMERCQERIRPTTKNTNGALSLVYVDDWKDQSIGAVKKTLRIEIGQTTNELEGQDRNGRRKEAP